MSAYAERIPAYRSPLWRQKGPFLPSLAFELTERCNNNCIHCCINLPADDLEAHRRELSRSELEDLLRQAAHLGCLSVRFTGGEPLLRPEFRALYEYARRLGMKVRLSTNARLVTSALADLFARIPPMIPIEVTVYGMSAQSYEAGSRAPGSYREFRQGVEFLLERAIPVTLRFALLPTNRHDLPAFDAWAQSVSACAGTPGISMFFSLRHRRDDNARNAEIRSVRVNPQDGVAILARDPERYRRETRQFCSRFMGSCGDVLFNCDAGLSGCVDAYGNYQPCLSLRTPELSHDVRRSNLREAIIATRARLKGLRARNAAYRDNCAKCSLKGLCDQCPALSWAETGTLDTPVAYLCQVAHAQARYLGLLPTINAGGEQ